MSLELFYISADRATILSDNIFTTMLNLEETINSDEPVQDTSITKKHFLARYNMLTFTAFIPRHGTNAKPLVLDTKSESPTITDCKALYGLLEQQRCNLLQQSELILQLKPKV